MNHPKFTPEQLARIPTLALLELHRQGNDADWPPFAYKGVEQWCGKHRPGKEHLWALFAWRVS
jgi:hypothetical protein